ncbi:MAG: hypothetical protein LBL00_07765 [Endomicrobium sp.]|jgi:hypothetical protein|nr:hypothetical protein [Endomicrobium sp.]
MEEKLQKNIEKMIFEASEKDKENFKRQTKLHREGYHFSRLIPIIGKTPFLYTQLGMSQGNLLGRVHINYAHAFGQNKPKC